ncbi:hypothetical protein SARC_11451 [Sphaeroforma arctica JP610]|uniref:Uncharacterized protein n=1 Tax=Sphaeroforma arctica JP610 TaxID=667725 RepID=A0A0L0FGZ1_9EUKA|nr:hypothetical protein SARC_11451 [Sphaeroforma arctica JP610]KNC76037.1 hypothetical protein SARC_11451 [Sphaeroforma arctica JP610]|eukprot:XP_014149939.1 hypothetical protein SARC_11451 [Sphaeroforma arctica JP610]
MKAGSKTELPYWLASMLCKMQFVRIDVPKVYTPKYTAKLIAGPETVAMSDWSPWYFLLARRYAEMTISGFNIGDELTQKVENLIPVLKETLLTRFRKIILTDHSRQGDMSLLMRKLSDVERRLVVKKELAVTDYEDWRKSSYTAGHVSGAQKRRR